MDDCVNVWFVGHMRGVLVVAVAASQLAEDAFASRIHLVSHLTCARPKTRHERCTFVVVVGTGLQ